MRTTILAASLICFFYLQSVFGQIDPEKRQLVQAGFNQPLIGKGPLSAYAFYYRNDPEFYRTNVTLRLAIAPVFVDSELGIAHALGENTDLGIGFAGGGFADSYSEVRDGALKNRESFTGHSGELSLSLYQLFNPGKQIPLYGILRVAGHRSIYETDSKTDDNFEIPQDRSTMNVRAGFRFGGKEPVMTPALGLELSAWNEGQFRTD